MPNRDRGITAIRVFLLRMVVKVFLKAIMQIDFVIQPRINGTPCSRLCSFTETLLDYTKTLSVFPIQRTDAINWMIAPIRLAIVVRPIFRWCIMISHKRKRSRRFLRSLSCPSFIQTFSSNPCRSSCHPDSDRQTPARRLPSRLTRTGHDEPSETLPVQSMQLLR